MFVRLNYQQRDVFYLKLMPDLNETVPVLNTTDVRIHGILHRHKLVIVCRKDLYQPNFQNETELSGSGKPDDSYLS